MMTTATYIANDTRKFSKLSSLSISKFTGCCRIAGHQKISKEEARKEEGSSIDN